MVLDLRSRAFLLLVASVGLTSGISSAQDFISPAKVAELERARLQRTVSFAVEKTLTEFANSRLQSNQIAVTVVDLRREDRPIEASYRGDVPIYPASVIKLFYLAAAHRWMENGKLADTAELRRAMKDMIVDSGNDPTHYIIDLLTGTTAGPELPADEMNVWSEKRNAVNRYFASLGFTNCNINQKPWGDGPYGRERIFLGKSFQNRNALTTVATARLLTEVVLGRAVSKTRSVEMMELLKRDPFKPAPAGCEPDQSRDFSGVAIKAGDRLWSKAGWTSTTRHDAAYIEHSKYRFVIVTFTTGHPNNRDIIPSIVRNVIKGGEY
jgi:beta-lactamase class A